MTGRRASALALTLLACTSLSAQPRKPWPPREPTVWPGNTGLLPDDPSFGRPQSR